MEANAQVHHQILNRERLDYIDSAKGVGSLLVIVGHHLLMSDNLIMWINSFHMPLFFILTGFLSKVRSTPQSATDSGDFPKSLKKKASSLLYPYVTFSVINFLWYLLFHSLLGFSAEESAGVVFVRMLTTYGYHALWFLPAMFFASVISIWGEGRGLFRPFGQILLIISGTLFSFVLNELDVPVNVLWYVLNYIGRIVIGIAFIGIGKWLFSFLKFLSGRQEWYLLLVSAAVSLLFFRYLPDISLSFSRIGNPVIFYPVACAGSVAVLLLCKKTAIGKNRFLRFWGKNSLVVLALHMDIPIQIAWIVLGASGLSSVLSPLYASVCAILIELTILFLAIVFINRFASYLLRPPVRRSTCTNTK